MFIYQILFSRTDWPKSETASFLNDADFFIRSLRSNGQLVSRNDVFIFNDQAVSIHVRCPHMDSLDTGYNSEHVNQWINILMERYGVDVSYQIVGEDLTPAISADEASSQSFILYWGGPSPIRSGDNFAPIPLYHFPYTNTRQGSYEDINAWSKSYEEIDGLWFRGNLGEQQFQSYLSDIQSPLTKQGRDICSRLEQLTGKPSYYYLFNTTGPNIEYHCPSCGGSWQLENKMLSRFDLKCDHCRLVSETPKA